MDPSLPGVSTTVHLLPARQFMFGFSFEKYNFNPRVTQQKVNFTELYE